MADDTSGTGGGGPDLSQLLASGRLTKQQVEHFASLGKYTKELESHLANITAESGKWAKHIDDALKSTNLIQEANEILGTQGNRIKVLQKEIDAGLHGQITQLEASRLIQDEILQEGYKIFKNNIH